MSKPAQDLLKHRIMHFASLAAVPADREGHVPPDSALALSTNCKGAQARNLMDFPHLNELIQCPINLERRVKPLFAKKFQQLVGSQRPL